MLEKIVEWSLRYRLLVVLAFVLITYLGVRALQEVPLDAFPDITPNQVAIYTESPGLAPEDVENLITFPVESAMAGLPDVEVIRSVSMFGLSYVSVYFDDAVDIYFARRLVMERLLEAKERIPDGYGTPIMGPNSTGLGQVYWYYLEDTTKTLSLMDLRALQDWTVRLLLRTAPGVDDVLSWGGFEKQFQIRIDPQTLIKYGLTLSQVIDAVMANNRQVGGQYLEQGPEQYVVRGVGLVSDVEDIQQIIVDEKDGVPIQVGDVATVVEGPGVRFGAVTKDGEEIVFGMVLQRTGSNAKAVVDGVKAKLPDVERALPEGVKIRELYTRSFIVEKAVVTATRALLEGAVLVMVVLFLFLGEFRSALVVITAIPLARLIAYVAMEHTDLSTNLMSLAGLIIGLGMTVDGAVVLVENTFRLLADRTRRFTTAAQAVLVATREVARPVAFAMFIILVVFLPLFGLEGLEGKLYKPLAFNMAFSMIGALILTFTIIPVLASLLLKPGMSEHEPRLVRWIKRPYRPTLQYVLRHPWGTMSVAGLLFASSLVLLPFFGTEFMPTLEEGSIMFRVTSIPSTSLSQSVAIAERLETAVKKFPEVEEAFSMIGRAERGESADMNYAELQINLKPKTHWRAGLSKEQLVEEMRQVMEKTEPTSLYAYTQPIQMRVEELISGVRATLAVKVYGDDMEQLAMIGQQVKDQLATVRGAKDLAIEAFTGKPQITITVDREAISRYGINADEVMQVVQAGIGGAPVSTLLDGVKRFDIVVRFDEVHRADVEAIKAIALRTSEGRLVSLDRVANIETSEGVSFIRRENLQRYVVISCNVEGRDIGSFVAEGQQNLEANVQLPAGYRVEWGGAFENQQRAMQRLAIIVPLTILLIFVLLYTMFDSIKYSVLILANIPFALIGGVWALFISGQHLSVPAAVGFIAVIGVAMLNGIVMVSVINDLRQSGVALYDAVVDGAVLRLRPVLMTMLVEVLGLLPLLLATGIGAETLRPLATVVVGGLLSATVLTLLILPLMYHVWERRAELKARPDNDLTHFNNKEGEQ